MKILSSSRVNPVEGMAEVQESQLVSECIAGNEAAIALFVRQYEQGVFRLAFSIVRDSAEAHEITQETFLSALRALPGYRERTSLKAWLYTIALNHSRSHIRKWKIRERLRASLTAILQAEAPRQVSPEQAILANEQEAAIWSSLHQLDERYRIVIVLRYFHDLRIAEIAEILSASEGTIHSRLHYAREKLRAALRHLHGD